MAPDGRSVSSRSVSSRSVSSRSVSSGKSSRSVNGYRAPPTRSASTGNMVATAAAAAVATVQNQVIMDLMDGLQDDDITDVVLVGNDAIPVRASKFVLACRSPVFKKLLYGEEPDQSTVSPVPVVLPCRGYNSRVLQAVVRYCFSNEFSYIAEKESVDDARELAYLAKFASKYQLQGLYQQVSFAVKKLIINVPALACAVYSISDNSDMEAFCMEMIQELPIPALLTPHDETQQVGVQYLSAARLENILKQKEALEMEEMTVFTMLQKWYSTAQDANKMEVAKRCGACIELKHIEPANLLTEVKHSNFFDSERILEAITEQALHANPCSIVSRKGKTKKVTLAPVLKRPSVKADPPLPPCLKKEKKLLEN